MTKQVNYTKYQKRVIKFLGDTLGTKTPFRYERAQNNHLKVLIDGVPKPLFTGSTPSDCKSLNNFMSEVKRELRALHTPQEEVGSSRAIKGEAQVSTSNFDEKLLQGCIKSLRNRLEVIKSKEEALVIEHKNVEVVSESRLQSVKHVLSHGLQQAKQQRYVKPKEMKQFEQHLLKHLNFMLPTLAFYSDLLNSKSGYQAVKLSSDALSVAQMEKMVSQSDCAAGVVGNIYPIQESALKEAQLCVSQGESRSEPPEAKAPILAVESAAKGQAAQSLMALSSAERIAQFRSLSRAQSLSLIEEIEQAMALNREQDIESVVALIKEKGLPLESIIARLEA